jgi:phosphoribosylaminoimidazole-succinocarboxamide synthase
LKQSESSETVGAMAKLRAMKFSDLQPVRSGKVRDVYDAGENLVIVASDRISAFDCILPTPIGDKGKILNTLSVFWLARTSHIIDNHLLLHRVADFPVPFNTPELEGRSMLVRRAEVVPVECVVRGYLAGSGWKDYCRTGEVSGIKLPAGLRESEQLPEPIWTPSTKAESGHDEPISFDEVVNICGQETAEKLRAASLKLYEFAANHARERGLILADTKFEFGFAAGDLILVDEVFTPDSSRFWDAETYAPGKSQDSFDKQYVRDYLETLDWDKTPPAPKLPPEVAQRTAEKYIEAYNRITGLQWPDSDVRAR